MREQQVRATLQRTSFDERHRAARDAVLTSQRGRLIEAMVECVEAKGYAATTLTDLVARARVSRSTFYEHFTNKEQCFVEAVHAGMDIVQARIADELSQLPPDADAVTRIECIVNTFCETVATEPDFARLILVESFKVDASAVGFRDQAVDGFAALYRLFYEQARKSDPALPHLSDTMLALIPDAIAERTRRVIVTEGATQVPTLAPTFIQFVHAVLGFTPTR
ncbi:TetR/AcrR family transcriptional regulator [Nocardia yamanashiensis]|uniref:TetR/AcrR family transcriptional regulator n=1 Tax=Nocardia yamanashiensis TaxID=209247 RepID=UPI000831F598|nr:TetR/AcrR family transcriptional regulator [Nocardia yamanashiensis]UGT38924.1 TetR/AcrR family transcriptional regulator [Nocardia yamanashiensis]